MATWILIIAGALLAVAAFGVRMRPAFKVVLAVVGVAILLAGLWTLLPGSFRSNPFGPAPGVGSSKADVLYKAAGPKLGETVFSPNPEDTATYLWDRIAQAANADPGLKFTSSETQSGGIPDSEKLVFIDGSSLTLRLASAGGTAAVTLQDVEIARP